MRITELKVTLTQTADGRPLATVKNFPGLDADMTPEQLRQMAGALLAAADECTARPIGRKHLSRVERSYQLRA